jgi:hypothetical protein
MIRLIDLLLENKIETYYHGTDLLFKDGNELKLPLWVTPDIGLATHFALRPSSSSKKTEKGYVYKLELNEPTLKKIDSRRYVLEDVKSIKILEISEYEPHPLVFAKKIKSITPNN